VSKLARQKRKNEAVTTPSFPGRWAHFIGSPICEAGYELELSHGDPGLHEAPPSTRWIGPVEVDTLSQPGMLLWLDPASRHRMPLSVLNNNAWLSQLVPER